MATRVGSVNIETSLLARNGEREPATGKGARTRQRLLTSARRAFERKGYLNTRVADIAKGAGVAHGTFYKYFESKDDIFRELTNQVVAAMYERSRPIHRAPDPVTRITLANWLYINSYREDAEFLAIVQQVVGFDPEYRAFWVRVRGRWADTIERWVSREIVARTADQRLDSRVAARALGLMMESFAHHWFVLGESYDERTALTTLTHLWINGLQLEVDTTVDVEAAVENVLGIDLREARECR